MPFARLTVADEQLSEEVQQKLAAGLTELLVADLRKAPATTAIQVLLTPAGQWFVGGVRHRGTTGAHLEVGITAGSNSAAEKAVFMAHAYEFLAETLGSLPPAVYVALFELSGESYGVNGRSQFARSHSIA